MAIPFKTPLRGLREGAEIVRRLLDGQRVTYAGEVFSIHEVALETPPVAPVPILLGVKGPRALALAAEVADGVHCSILDLAGSRPSRARQHAECPRRLQGHRVRPGGGVCTDR